MRLQARKHQRIAAARHGDVKRVPFFALAFGFFFFQQRGGAFGHAAFAGEENKALRIRFFPRPVDERSHARSVLRFGIGVQHQNEVGF